MSSSVDAKNLYAFQATSLLGEPVSLEQFRGQVLLVVNVASQCAFTSQYRELQSLYETYRDQGFSVLGFPCNQFGGQEPGTNEEIADFCSITYDVTFPMFQRIDVNGATAHPLFTYLKSAQPGLLGQCDQMELYEVLDLAHWSTGGPLCADHQPQQTAARDRRAVEGLILRDPEISFLNAANI